MNPIDRRAVVTVAGMALLSPTVLAQTALRVEAAWARPTVQGQTVGGGYLKITGGSKPDRLLSATSPVSQSVELHTMEMQGNVMRMRSLDAIDVPAGGRVELAPGGRHVMFVGLKQVLAAGARFPMTLRFEHAGDVSVQVKVMSPAQPPADHAAGHKH